MHFSPVLRNVTTESEVKTEISSLLYFSIFLHPQIIAEFFNQANLKRIKILNVKEFEEYALVRLYSKDVSKFEKVEIVESQGLPCICKKYLHRIGFLVGLFLFFTILIFSPKFVWEIKVEGLDKITVAEVGEALRDAGVEIGTYSPSILRSDVYSRVILSNKDISWISVNFIGSTAYVEIIEREYTPVSDTQADGANIIAACDGQIIDTDIKCGRRIVNIGDVVKKGDLLVSGIYDSVKAGTRFVYSDAKVYARVTEKFSTVIPLKRETKTYCDEDISNIDIKIFKKKINIFKKDTQTCKECDTIIRENNIPYSGLRRLPIIIEKTCCLPYELSENVLTEAEALALAKNSVANMISDAGFKDVVFISENYYFENEQLYFNCEVEAVKNIAFVNEFNIN